MNSTTPHFARPIPLLARLGLALSVVAAILLTGGSTALAYGSSDGTLGLSAYHGQVPAAFSATYTWQGSGACQNNQKAVFYWDYQFQHSTQYYMGNPSFVQNGSACSASVVVHPPSGDNDYGAHDLTVWNTSFGPGAQTWIYYMVDQAPTTIATPVPTPVATAAATPPPAQIPTPHPTPPTAAPIQNGTGSAAGVNTLGNSGSTPAATPSPAGRVATLTSSATGGGQSSPIVAALALAMVIAATGSAVWIRHRRRM